jgi:NADPH-dependent 2,4-dienoyl-CoA reductase/sulfur reductase-like enzyme
MENPIFHPFAFIYQLIQWFLDKLLSPNPPQPGVKLGRPKIAIIGAGLTGVSAASHCVGHGFDVQIFEAGPREQLGGIWSVSLLLFPCAPFQIARKNADINGI